MTLRVMLVKVKKEKGCDCTKGRPRVGLPMRKVETEGATSEWCWCSENSVKMLAKIVEGEGGRGNSPALHESCARIKVADGVMQELGSGMSEQPPKGKAETP